MIWKIHSIPRKLTTPHMLDSIFELEGVIIMFSLEKSISGETSKNLMLKFHNIDIDIDRYQIMRISQQKSSFTKTIIPVANGIECKSHE